MQSILVLTFIISCTIIPIQSRVCDEGSTWYYDRSHTGMRPDCPPAAIWNEQGYLWHSIAVVQAACERHPTCNIFNRYDGGGRDKRCDTCYGHNYAHSCPDLNNITWITETRWGIGATTTNNYQLDCIPGPTMEPTPQPTPYPTEVDQLPCQCYEILLVDEMSDGVGSICYEYEVSANINPPAGAMCGDLEYVVLGQGRADNRCGLSDISTVVTSISFAISDVSTMGGVTYDFAFDGDGGQASGIKIGGISGGDSFTICFEESQVFEKLEIGRISYRQNGVETMCEAEDLLPNLCPPRAL